MAERNLAIRLAVIDGGKVKAEVRDAGERGEERGERALIRAPRINPQEYAVLRGEGLKPARFPPPILPTTTFSAGLRARIEAQ